MRKRGSESAAYPSAGRDGLSRDVGGLLRTQEGHHAADFLHPSEPEGRKPRRCVYQCSRDNTRAERLEPEPHLRMLRCFLILSEVASFSHSWSDKQRLERLA